MIIAFIDEQREQGLAVESILAVLVEEGLPVAARTYRAWRQGPVADRTHTDALITDTIRDLAWRAVTLPDGRRRRQLAPKGLYGRRKMLALVRRHGHVEAETVRSSVCDRGIGWLMVLAGEPVSKVDLEGCAGCCPGPVALPLGVGADDREVDQLCRGLFIREVPAGLDRFADLAVQALDGVGIRYETR